MATVVSLGTLASAPQGAKGNLRRRLPHARDRGLRDGARGAGWWRYVLVGIFLVVGSVSHGIGQTLLFSVHGGGRQASAGFGSALASLGDVTGDGIPDLAVGVPFQDVADRKRAGQVEVLSGADGRHLHTLRAPRPQEGALFGHALVSLGDVTGDGLPDLAISAPTYDGRGVVDLGQVFVFSGANTP
jgi:hypothetical protein